MDYKIGQEITVNGRTATIEKIYPDGVSAYTEGDDDAMFYEFSEIAAPMRDAGEWDYYTPAAHATENLITDKSIERYENKVRQARRCKRCGQTDLFDGVMFTNGGGDICDDCF
jgi:hypothetical protein